MNVKKDDRNHLLPWIYYRKHCVADVTTICRGRDIFGIAGKDLSSNPQILHNASGLNCLQFLNCCKTYD